MCVTVRLCTNVKVADWKTLRSEPTQTSVNVSRNYGQCGCVLLLAVGFTMQLVLDLVEVCLYARSRRDDGRCVRVVR